MADYIDWKARYIELEDQLLQMMEMTIHLIDKEVHQQKAKISGLETTYVDRELTVTVKSKSANAQYLFELLNTDNDVLLKQETGYRNNHIFNIEQLDEPFKVRVSIRNEGHDSYDDVNESKIFNAEDGQNEEKSAD
ncbi:hypothetical protein [Macrococcus equipercicus]|uniref:Uncharacterized protein n=1 Tax=Macrococcus equipercicus TaxID=69967 RepID=A0A9Q9BPV0_9STAP|nr:hypothetical protein [Macrococcus equipercicus]UTH14490.1 hypothetical protein KFV11_03780 [Macrococcus equipercicus]